MRPSSATDSSTSSVSRPRSRLDSKQRTHGTVVKRRSASAALPARAPPEMRAQSSAAGVRPSAPSSPPN
eukprot:scaffold97074_cov28-Tisochrysis_lutea.AAC.2